MKVLYHFQIFRTIKFLVLGGFILLLGGCSCNGGGQENPSPDVPPTSEPKPPENPPEPSPAALPDLVIIKGTMDPNVPIVAAGTTMKFIFEIQNQGAGEVPSGYRVNVTGPGNYSNGFSGGLKPNETQTVIVEYPVVSPGVTYSNIVFTIDIDNVIPESNDNNNSSQAFAVQTAY